MKPTVRRFRIRRGNDGDDAGNGNEAQARRAQQPSAADLDKAEVEAIRAEDLTARQLRMARRVAQKHGFEAASDQEAVQMLRKAGIDPFKRATLLDLVVSEGAQQAPDSAEGGVRNLPATRPEAPVPSTERAAPKPSGIAFDEIRAIQQDIAKRRRRRLGLLGARLAVFVLLPTLLVGWYYAVMATPLFTTESEFVIQQADSGSSAQSGGVGGLFTGTALAASQDSMTVQSYLQSRDAMLRLDREQGFRAHFSGPEIDPLLRLEPGATSEAAYRLFRRLVRIGYDPTEGLVRMEVRAADPETSHAFSRALISYAEEQVDQMTQRLREAQMTDAREGFERAERRMQEARERVVDLQERYRVLSSDVEVSLLTTQIGNLETELMRERLSLQELLANPRPNPARVDPLQRRIANLEAEIAIQRARLTQGGADGISLARIASELVMAESDVQTRQLLLSQSLQQMEAARIEANRQVRYLSLGVPPVTPDEASHPRAFESTLLAFLVFAGVYLMISMTASILREQISA